jgi:hypothetical protein
MRLLSIPQLGYSSPSLSVGWMVLYSDNLRSRTPGFTPAVSLSHSHIPTSSSIRTIVGITVWFVTLIVICVKNNDNDDKKERGVEHC